MKNIALYSNLPVYRDCYAVTLEFAKIRGSLSRDTRYTIAQDLSRVLVDMMVTIYRANSSRTDKVRLIAELRRQAVETQIYFRLLSDMHQLGATKAAFFMDKIVSIGKQLVAWHRSAVKESRISNGAEPSSCKDGRPECVGLRSDAVSCKVNPMNSGKAACSCAAAISVAKGSLTENTEESP